MLCFKALKVVHSSNTVSFLWLFLSYEHLTAPFLFSSLNLRREGPTRIGIFPDIIPQPRDSEEKVILTLVRNYLPLQGDWSPSTLPTQPPYRNANYSLLFLIQYSITFISKMSQRKLNYYDVLDMQESKWTYILMYLQFSVCGSRIVFTGTFLKLMKCPNSTVTHTSSMTPFYMKAMWTKGNSSLLWEERY